MEESKKWPYLLFLLAANPAVCETLHRWIDETGTVHFSDIPPSASDTQILELDPVAPMSQGRTRGGLRSGEKRWLSEVERAERKAERQRDKDLARRASEQAERSEACSATRRALGEKPDRARRAALLIENRRLQCGIESPD